MVLEKKVNSWGQEQIIESFDKIIKIGDRFLNVRLIKTKKWKSRFDKNGEFTAAMPRAKFIGPQDEKFYYLVSKKDILEMKKERRKHGS